MGVVLTVTRIAVRRCHHFRDVPGHMAGVAIKITVRTRQRIVGLGVIKAPSLPAIRIVAVRAIRPETAFVMLVLVAGIAIQRRVLVRGRPVALLARHHRVAPDQGKPRKIVIERRGSAPAALAVTFLAVVAELALVFVVCAVTGNACCRQLVAIEVAGMAVVALDLRVAAS